LYSSQILEKNLIIKYSKKNLYSFLEYYKILSKKDLISKSNVSKSNICFNLIFLIEDLILRFADM